ncbi:MAG TPA: hypothetical protein VK157_01370 [Phycisphaerales bacterium]|nr:hypothetical protein [Phycisphaerales bacterium]
MPPHPPQPDEPHLTDEQFVAFVLGEADQQTSDAIATAAQTDGAVARRVSAVRAMCSSLEHLHTSDASFAVTPQQRARLVALMPSERTDWFAELTARASEVAMLVMDSLRGTTVAGYRSTDTSGARLLRYECMGGTIDLRVELNVASNEVAVTGQYSGPETLSDVRLLHRENGDELARATPAADGYFECIVPPGVYAIEVVAHDGTSTVVPRVELGETDSSTS